MMCVHSAGANNRAPQGQFIAQEVVTRQMRIVGGGIEWSTEQS